MTGHGCGPVLFFTRFFHEAVRFLHLFREIFGKFSGDISKKKKLMLFPLFFGLFMACSDQDRPTKSALRGFLGRRRE